MGSQKTKNKHLLLVYMALVPEVITTNKFLDLIEPEYQLGRQIMRWHTSAMLLVHVVGEAPTWLE